MPDGDVWYFDRLAPVYDALMPSADRGSLLTALDLAHREVERVVDVAGGTGRAVATIDAPDRIVVDASAGMLARIPAGIGAVRASADRLPLRDESADAVLLVDALHHLPRQSEVIHQAARILRPDGVLIVREFDRTTLTGRGIELGERAIGMQSAFLTADEITDALREAGLESAVTDRGVSCTVVGRKPGPP